MQKRLLTLCVFFAIASCGKKTTPTRSPQVIYKKETPAPKRETVRKPVEKKEDFPKMIYVNDAAASKSVDGRMYYDVKGHRYWKNYKDGNYYLFDKSMYNNPDFKPPNKR